ncbi:MAG: glycine cleavage system aminomethyltransferase GcvT [Thermovirgaceae bacterium]
MKKTPLYQKHVDHGGRVVDFSGWALPVQYSGIVEEHKVVREAAGLFDVSHMGEISVTGRGAADLVYQLVVNDTARMKPGKVMYTPMCYETGGVVDDILVYMKGPGDWLLAVNAANTDKDYEWILEQASGMDVTVKNESDETAQVALQGPKAEAIMKRITKAPVQELTFYTFMDDVDLDVGRALVSRTGYTGEDGFEIYMPTKIAPKLWDRIMEAGKDEGLVPAGLGARDTLRFEACLPLYGHELEKDITPLEAGLNFTVKLDKTDFIGKKALVKQKEEGLRHRIAGLEMLDKGVPRHGYEVYADGKAVGTVTSGSFAPSLDAYLAMALVDVDHSELGTHLEIDIRGRKKSARIVKRPFYTPRYKR